MNMMSEIDIDSLTIEQYLMLTKGNQALSMGEPEFGRTIKKNILEMTIVEYIEYEAEMERQTWRNAYLYFPTKYDSKNVNSFNHMESWNLDDKYHSDNSKINAHYDLPLLLPYFEPIQPHTKDRYESLEEDTDFVSEDQSEIGPEEDLDEWLKIEMEKRMCRKDKESEEDALIDILKSLVEECKVVYKEASYRGTNVVQGVSFIAEDEEGDTSGALPCQLPPKELNPGSFTLPCIIGEPNETMILGMPFLATIHAQIDVFKREISLGIGEDRVEFDMDGGISHSRILVEKIYMASSVHEKEYFNPLEYENDVFSYESPSCLLFKQRTQSYDNKSVDTLDSAGSIQELEDNHKDVVIDSFDVEFHFGKTRDDPYSRRFDEYKEEFANEIKQLTNEYDLRVGRKRYALDDVWEKCEKFHDTTYPWHNKGFKEEKQWESGIGKRNYKPSFVKSETFEVKRYSFKNGKSFMCITKQFDDALPLGIVNGSRFMGMTRKEMD
ncbi:hypothetical protein Tco_1176568 [Tanacetum coccineum]